MNNKIQFSIEAYNTGKYDVVTRDGVPVEIKFTDGRHPYPILGYVGEYYTPMPFYHNGQVYKEAIDSIDLFLVEKVVYWDRFIIQVGGNLSPLFDGKEQLENHPSYYLRDSIHQLRLYSNGKAEIIETIYHNQPC